MASGMSGTLYLACAIVHDAVFLRHVIRLYRRFDARLAARTFGYSILYLSCLFAALLLDHYVRF